MLKRNQGYASTNILIWVLDSCYLVKYLPVKKLFSPYISAVSHSFLQQTEFHNHVA